MRTSKDRRSERVAATHRLLLTILGASGAEMLKEIITTIEVSQHGARIKGRRTLQPNWKGALVQLSSGRQAPVRIVWQVKSATDPQYLESGIEILADYNFWDRVFASGDAEPERSGIELENIAMLPEELLRAFSKSSAFKPEQSGKLLETVWCGLVEQLEERNVFTRKELVAAIRRITPV